MTAKRNKKTSLSDVLETILDDHELFEEFVLDFNRMFVHGRTTVPKKAADATRQFCEKLIGHFAYEEKHIFSELLVNMPRKDVAQRIALLQKEHTALEKQAKQLDRMLSPANLTYLDINSLHEEMWDLIVGMQSHADKENDLFPSLL